MIERQVVHYLKALRQRQPLPLTVALWDGSEVRMGEAPRVSIRVKSAPAARYLLKPSLDALGEAYVEGHLDVDGHIDELFSVAESLARTVEGADTRGALPQPLSRMAKAVGLGRHKRARDRRAIEYHYDVSNEFYARWLDPKMVYSCAYFENPALDLAQAQTAKLEHICRKLRLAPGQTLLDIGCGWGALALHAARHHGVKVLGITLSARQGELANRRIMEAGLGQQVEIRLQDYRDLPADAHFDRIASVGMFEHVGLDQLNGYFRSVHRLLKPGGVALNHGITSSDPDSREVGLGAGSFIDRYVFPDGELPHVSLAIREMAAAGLELVDAESLRRHYALTLRHWSRAFEQHLDELAHMVGEQRARIWRVYLAGCAHAFEKDWINIYQLLAVKGTDGEHPLPMTRDFMYRDQ